VAANCVNLNAVDHVGEEGRHVFAHSHVGDDFLYSVHLLFSVRSVDLNPKLMHLGGVFRYAP